MKKLHPLVKFKNFWDKLDAQEQPKLWDFLTALRGPDNEDANLKHKTTEVIRSFLLKINHNCPANTNRCDIFKISLKNNHFTRHTNRAMTVINQSKLKRII